ncbi:MAG TPA: transposase [Gaiellaceae bacterium]|nr:transposase [Gaiellaceae bacterium]
MPRAPRIQYAGALYHVTTRGNERGAIFVVDADRELLLAILADVVERLGWICHAYCLMTNHYHLAIQTPQANLWQGMHMLNSRYVKAFQRREGRSGHLLEGRYRPTLVVRQEHLLEVARYVVLNPVRAGICERAEDWPWSSYRAAAGLAPRPSFLTTEWLLGCFGGNVRRYREFVAAGSPAASIAALLLV